MEIGGNYMKKNNHKKYKLLMMVLAVATIVSSFIMMNTKAETKAPQTLTISRIRHLPSYIGASYMPSVFSTSAGGYAYCNRLKKTDPVDMKLNLVGEAGPGIAYILSHGYPNTSMTGNADFDDYITRMAIWWYLDEVQGKNDLSNEFKTQEADPNNLRPYIIKLVNEAKAIKTYDTASFALMSSNESMHLSADKKYYETNAISANASNITGNYTIAVSGGPEGVEVVNANSNVAQTAFAVNESFKIRIPAANVKESSHTIKVTATANSTVNKAYEYTTSSEEYQNVYALFKESTSITTSMNVTLETSKLTVMKVDSKTGKTLAGATFELLDSNGKKITSWTSTTNAHIIKNLPNGTYTLKETKAPTGYKLKEEKVTITIDDKNRDVTVKMENEAVTKLVNIIKIDKSTGKPLAGARIVVKNANGEKVADFVSTEDPYTITKLADGTYTVEEISAPAGYKKNDDIYRFTISDDTPTAEVIVENYPEVVVPYTGSHQSMLPTILGTLVFISGIGVVYYHGKKQKQ